MSGKDQDTTLEQGAPAGRTAIDKFGENNGGIFHGLQPNYASLDRQGILDAYFSSPGIIKTLFRLARTSPLGGPEQMVSNFYDISMRVLEGAVHKREQNRDLTGLLKEKVVSRLSDEVRIPIAKEDLNTVGIVLAKRQGKYFLGSWIVVVDDFSEASRQRIVRLQDILLQRYRQHREHFLENPNPEKNWEMPRLICAYPEGSLHADEKQFLEKYGVSSYALPFGLEEFYGRFKNEFGSAYAKSLEERKQPPMWRGRLLRITRVSQKPSGEVSTSPRLAGVQFVPEGEPEVVLPTLEQIEAERRAEERKLLKTTYLIDKFMMQESLVAERRSRKKKKRKRRSQGRQSEDEE